MRAVHPGLENVNTWFTGRLKVDPTETAAAVGTLAAVLF